MNASSIQFGTNTEMGLVEDDLKAYSFILPFVSLNSQTITNPLGNIGITLGAAPSATQWSTTNFSVTLDPDYNYKLLWIKYTAVLPSIGGFLSYLVPDLTYFYDFFNMQLQVGFPIIRFVDMSVSFASYNQYYLYGGQNLDKNNGQGSLLPINITSLQGDNSGNGSIRTRYWLAKNSTINFEARNHLVFPIVLNGAIGGLKVRL